MTRSFYSSALFFTLIYIGVAFLKIAVFFVLGARTGELSLLGGLLAFEFLISLIWSLILLKYYHVKGYGFSFATLIASIIASFLVLLSLSSILSTRQLSDYFIVATLASMTINVFYAGGLIVSKTSERPWLRVAGIILLLQGLIFLFSMIWGLNSTTFMQGGALAKVERWASLSGILAYVLFALNFAHEKVAAEDSNKIGGKSLVPVMRFVSFIALFSGLFFGPRLVAETISLRNDPERINKNLKELAQPFEAHIFSNSRGERLPYRLLKPLHYDSTKKYPLVVCLHGSSGCGNDNVKQVVGSLTVQLLSEYKNRIKYPAFLLVPQCPHERSWGGIPDLPAVDSLVFEIIHALEQKLPIDKDRRYVTGNSLGGYGVWHFINTRPDMFAAAIPISGGGNPALAKNIIDVPVWAFHGAKDRNVSVIGSRLMIDGMKKIGGNPLYTEYPDAAHDINERIKKTPGLLDWLFAQKLKERTQVDIKNNHVNGIK